MKKIMIFLLLGVPGVETRTGIYHFSSRSDLKIRFSQGTAASAKAAEKQADLSHSYHAVPTPPVVLDAVNCFATFEESGNVLSVIMATIPPEADATFAVHAQPGAEIWQCRINGKRVKVYIGPEGSWILPLARDRASRMELALLSRGEKMGLHGRLEMTLPRMALPSRRVNIALGLPERVDLVSFQGPISPASAFEQATPDEFSGTPYYFSRSFHKGQSIQLFFLVLFSYTFFIEGITGIIVACGTVVTLGILMKVTAGVDWDRVFISRPRASGQNTSGATKTPPAQVPV